jgi:hypothetical protein
MDISLELLVLVHDFVLVMLLLVIRMLFPLEILIILLMITLVLLLELIFWHASKWDSKTSFLNQILHLANPHDKLSALCVSKSWIPKYLPTNPMGSKTRTSLSLSLLSYVGRRILGGEHEL